MTESLSDRIVRVALSQIGEYESAPNVTKYHDWYDSFGAYKYQGQPWCAIFVCWVLDQAGARLPTIQGSEFGCYPGAAGVAILRTWMQQQGWQVETPGKALPGDIIFHQWSHTGILIRDFSRQGFIVVEGNTTCYPNPGSEAEWVWPRVRQLAEIAFVCRVPDGISWK